MSNRETHSSVGLVSGLGYAAFEAKGQATLNVVAEIAGGALGGYWGGQLPDWIEPALHSWHRSVAHSGAAGATIVVHARSTLLSEMQQYFKVSPPSVHQICDCGQASGARHLRRTHEILAARGTLGSTEWSRTPARKYACGVVPSIARNISMKALTLS